MAVSIQIRGRRTAQAGFSLIELMISLVIGMVVVGAVMAAYLGSGASSRNSRALSQVTEDASVALNVLRTGIGMAGYSSLTGVNGAGQFVKAYAGPTLFGCDNGFVNPAADIAALACNPGAGTDAIAVAYEADAFNSVVNGANVPLDCLGNPVPAGGGVPFRAYNRYYLQGNQLMCMGPGNPDPQALVDNVVDLQIRYGVANAANLNQVRRYADAAALLGGPGGADWATNVVSVRICVLVASADNVLDADGISYRDCANNDTVPPDGDRRLFRAFTTTVVLQNRLGNMR